MSCDSIAEAQPDFAVLHRKDTNNYWIFNTFRLKKWHMCQLFRLLLYNIYRTIALYDRLCRRWAAELFSCQTFKQSQQWKKRNLSRRCWCSCWKKSGKKRKQHRTGPAHGTVGTDHQSLDQRTVDLNHWLPVCLCKSIGNTGYRPADIVFLCSPCTESRHDANSWRENLHVPESLRNFAAKRNYESKEWRTYGRRKEETEKEETGGRWR